GYYIPVGHISPNAPDGTPEGVLPSGQADTSSSATVQFSLLDDAPPSQLPLKQVLDAIRPALTNPAIGKIAHNAKYDFVVMQRYGIDVHPITFDTMLAEWLVKPDESSRLGLKPLALARLNIHMTEID